MSRPTKANMHLAVLSLIFASASLIAAGQYSPQTIAKEERCLVCGMYPSNYPNWHSQIVFKDGKHSSFDSQMDMFRYLQSMTRYDKNHAENDIGAIYVVDHENKSWLDAKKAFFVSGSRINGPMGADLPAFTGKKQALDFTRKSGGNVLEFQQVTPSIVNGGSLEHMH